VFILTVVAAFVQYLTSTRLQPGNALLLIALGAVYCVLSVVWFTRCHPDHSPRLPPWPYLAVQLVIASALSYLSMHMANGGEVLWLIALPLVSHAFILLPARRAAMFAIGVIAAFAATMFAFGAHPTSIATNAITYATSVLFVAFFTIVAVNAIGARQQVERLARELRDANLRLSEYAAQVEELATTRERNRLAREVHDSLGHYLTVANVQLEAARATLDSDIAKSRAAIDKAQTLTRDGLAEVRRSVAALRAGPLETRTLRDAISTLVDESRATGLQIDYTADPALPALLPQCELVLYRAAQEGLTNVRKHSAATRATVALQHDADAVFVRISDPGPLRQAPQQPDRHGGSGIFGLIERARLIGGDVQVETSANGGFVLCACVPAITNPEAMQ
jgi:signal transduction histidine kinase